MIVNSDERQWAWMDEGLNSFLESNVMWKYYPDLPYEDNKPSAITGYMKSSKDKQRSIMTNPEQVLRLGPNAYTKPAAALNLLRNTILGPELFDQSFKAYAQRWKFKHPTPADFFRTMEDASAVDLDWFWRGWFYTTDHVDIAIDEVKYFRIATSAKDMEKNTSAPKGDLGKKGEDNKKTDFSDGPQYVTVSETPSFWYGEYRNKLDDDAVRARYQDKHMYEVNFTNEGGLVSPIIVQFNYKDGTTENKMIPVEIWRKNENKTRKLFVLDKEVENITFDPANELADTESSNNVFPKPAEETKVDEFKKGDK
jgi:aminopeptidase N